MKYRFTRHHRGKNAGEEVPEGWDWGIVSSLMQRGVVEEVPELETAKMIESPPEDKAITSPARAKVRRK